MAQREVPTQAHLISTHSTVTSGRPGEQRCDGSQVQGGLIDQQECGDWLLGRPTSLHILGEWVARGQVMLGSGCRVSGP